MHRAPGNTDAGLNSVHAAARGWGLQCRMWLHSTVGIPGHRSIVPASHTVMPPVSALPLLGNEIHRGERFRETPCTWRNFTSK